MYVSIQSVWYSTPRSMILSLNPISSFRAENLKSSTVRMVAMCDGLFVGMLKRFTQIATEKCMPSGQARGVKCGIHIVIFEIPLSIGHQTC